MVTAAAITKPTPAMPPDGEDHRPAQRYAKHHKHVGHQPCNQHSSRAGEHGGNQRDNQRVQAAALIALAQRQSNNQYDCRDRGQSEHGPWHDSADQRQFHERFPNGVLHPSPPALQAPRLVSSRNTSARFIERHPISQKLSRVLMVSPDSVQHLFTSGLAPAVQGQCQRWISGAQACPSFSRKQGICWWI